MPGNELRRFSKKQLRTLTWWCGGQEGYDAVICDGAIRSGKTFCLSLSFFLWACISFHGRSFAVCGKTLKSVRRNVIEPLLPLFPQMAMCYVEDRGQHRLEVSFEGNRNRFYLFGGRDESSAASIQGMTLQGVLFDEVALMPRSFVEQALARCSDERARFFFNCNPEHPHHWFFEEWVCRAAEKNALYLHFSMDDNPALSSKAKERYASLYSGAFFDRFVRGLWTRPEGLVYPMFDEEQHVVDSLPEAFEEYGVSCDYGTVNPCSMGLWGRCGDVWFRIREFYHDARREGFSMTDEEYHRALETLCEGLAISFVVVDPSAASFIETIRHKGLFEVVRADNEVNRGIRRVMDLLREERLLFHRGCTDSIREFSLYCWSRSADSPVKQFDHAMDDIRYFVMHTAGREEDDFFVLSPARR